MTKRKDKRTRYKLLSLALPVLCVASAAVVIYFANLYPVQLDITYNSRNTLSAQSADLLKQLPGPLQIVAFATPQDPKSGDIRKIIRDFLAPYHRLKPNLRLQFIDPREQPKLAADADIRVNGEMVLSYGERNEHLTALNEQAFASALLRLARARDRLILYLDGHGERKLNGIANFDLGDFGKQLKIAGFRINSVNLSIAQEVPTNASFLVIANPQIDLLPIEMQKIIRYLEAGGNLLWFVDQEPLHGLQLLAEYLELLLTPGTVVDPLSAQYNAPPTLAVASTYDNKHAITEHFNLNTVFPFARQLNVADTGNWHITPLVEVAQRAWVETSDLNQNIRFDKNQDSAGPITVALAYERSASDKPQRVVVIGSGNFLANTYLGLLGNRDLGVNIVNWLADDDAFIMIQPRATIDTALDLSKVKLAIIAVSLLILLPLLFLGRALRLWWKKRKI